LLCGNDPRALGNTYILTGDEPVTLNELVRVICEVFEVSPRRLRVPVTPVYLAAIGCELVCKPLGINPPLYRRRVDFFRKTRWFDVSKAKAELGFRPAIDLRTGIERTADWYRSNGYL
jgi:nucleoside-diphosphate-sugar epimerase